MLRGVFERFTETARLVVVNAQEAAREMGHRRIGSEHLLLGLLWDPDQLPSRVLAPLGVSRESAQAKLVEIVGRGEGTAGGQIPFTPGAKKILELSLRERLSLGHNEIRPGHLLLGLLRDDEGTGVRILLDLNVVPAELRGQVIDRLGKEDPQGVGQPVRRVEHGPDWRFVARPDPELQRLLMRAAGHAFADAREAVTVADLRAAIEDLPNERSGTDQQDAGETSG
jgi:ATP-dependent Clp protease ATP-binding subunit ClpA